MKRITALTCAVAFCLAAICFIAYAEKDKTSSINTESQTDSTALTAETVPKTAVQKGREPDAIVFIEPADIYKTEEEKFSDSKLSFLCGTVIKTKPIEIENEEKKDYYTCSTVKIGEVFKGEIESETIDVIEFGGTDSLTSQFVSYSGYIPASVGDEVIFAVYKIDSNSEYVSKYLKENIDPDRTYRVAGAVQGKLTLENGKYVSNTPQSFFVGNAKTSFTLEEYRELAKKMLKK